MRIVAKEAKTPRRNSCFGLLLGSSEKILPSNLISQNHRFLCYKALWTQWKKETVLLQTLDPERAVIPCPSKTAVVWLPVLFALLPELQNCQDTITVSYGINMNGKLTSGDFTFIFPKRVHGPPLVQ